MEAFNDRPGCGGDISSVWLGRCGSLIQSLRSVSHECVDFIRSHPQLIAQIGSHLILISQIHTRTLHLIDKIFQTVFTEIFRFFSTQSSDLCKQPRKSRCQRTHAAIQFGLRLLKDLQIRFRLFHQL